MITDGAGLIGRTAEFDRLAALLDTATAQRRGGGAAISGEPGIGKTALVGAVTAHAGRSGWAVLQGRGHDLESRLDYGPLAAALSGYLHRLPPERRAGYCTGLDSLGALVEGIGAPERADGHPGGPDPSRSRLFQSVALLLGRITADAPVLLVVDDLHWADPASVDVLNYLRADVDALGVVLLVALRAPVEAARTDVRRLVAELARLPLHASVPVRRLGTGQVAELA
ncbi:MAG: ATP-binding protein, partial [Actinomycetota bacterium]|nr:ATP-binding protein [Actinomycetota bacterium]